MDTIKNFIMDILRPFGMLKIGVIDVFEMLLIAVLIYNIIKWMKNTRAWQLVKGILVLFVFFILANILKLNAILWLFKNGIGSFITAILIVFQPELRKALEHLGNRNIVSPLFNTSEEDRFSEDTINAIMKATFEMAKVRTGALIVIEREMSLDEFVETGIILDAKVSGELLTNIFEHNTPLHDGAVVIRGNRITAATCYLHPTANNNNLSKELGTRHRAAVGLSEETDGFAIVVSEESGAVSVASQGELFRRISRDSLYDMLKEVQNKANVQNNKSRKTIFGIERKKSSNKGF